MLGQRKIGAEDVAYGDVRVGEGHCIHQIRLDAAALAASRDANGFLPPGLPVRPAGTPVSAAGQNAVVIGPEPVALGAVNTFGNVICSQGLNGDQIAANLGRAITADERAALLARPFVLFPLV